MAAAWEHSAQAYSRSFAQLCAGTTDDIVRRLRRTSGHRLLDIGTGPGTIAAAADACGYTVIGMDSDRSMATLAADRHPGITFARAALPHLPCADQTFDVITANFVLNHIADPRAATRELRRVLRRGGHLVATIWTSQVVPLNQLWNRVMHEASVHPPAGLRLPAQLDFERTEQGFAGLLTEAGFAEVDCQETRWTFTIAPDELWTAVEAGIAVIGQTYLAQTPRGQERLRAAYRRITAAQSVDGSLLLPSLALIATGEAER